MKKVLILFSSVLLLLCLGLFPEKINAASVKDQYYQQGTSSFAIDWLTWPHQTFTPSKNKLDKIAVELVRGNGIYSISCSIKRRNLKNNDWEDVTNCGTKSPAAGTAWNYFDFDDVDVTPGRLYGIFLDSSDGAGERHRWKGNFTSANYAGGKAFVTGSYYDNGDFNFFTLGYDVSPSSTEGGTTNDTSGSTANGTASGTTDNNTGASSADQGQSTGSNKTEGATPSGSDAATTTPTTKATTASPLIWILGGIELLLIATLITLIIKRRRKNLAQKNQAKAPPTSTTPTEIHS